MRNKSIKILSILLGIMVLLIGFVGILARADADTNELTELKITILHTNDLHGQLKNFPQYATIVKQIRSEGGNVLLLDLYRRGRYQRFHGAAETEIFNAMGYDAVVFGNNDFPQNDRELFNISEHTILQMAEFPVLLGNATTMDGEYLEGFEPYIIMDMQDVKIAVIGITSPKPWDRGFDFTQRVRFERPAAALNRLVEETKEISDIQIALSHAGLDIDRGMRGVSAIIGGDSHTKLSEPFVINDGDRRIPIVQAGGEDDHYLGQLDLMFVLIGGEWILNEFSGFLHSLEDITPDAEIQEIIDKYDYIRLNPAA
jgi:5'-nucleotidase